MCNQASLSGSLLEVPCPPNWEAELGCQRLPLFLQTIRLAWLGLTQRLVLSVSLGLPWLWAWWELEPWQLRACRSLRDCTFFLGLLGP